MRRPGVFALVLASSCATPEPPTISPESAVITRIDAAGIALLVTISITNPNRVDLTADHVQSHLLVDGRQDVGAVVFPERVTLAPGAKTKLEVPLTLYWKDAGLLAQLAARASAIPYSVDGTLEMGGSLVHVGVPFHVEGAIARDQLASAMMRSFP